MTESTYHQHVPDQQRALPEQAAGWPMPKALRQPEAGRWRGSTPHLLAIAPTTRVIRSGRTVQRRSLGSRRPVPLIRTGRRGETAVAPGRGRPG